MYVCILETGRVFFEGCAHPAARPLISATHPYPSIRELTRAPASQNAYENDQPWEGRFG